MGEMFMSGFQFTKSQRVTIPAAMAGAENVQGLVAEGHAELGAEPRYILQWPNADKLGDAGLFTMVVGEVGQGALIAAQPPAMIARVEAMRMAMKTADDRAAAIYAGLESARQARAAKRSAARKASARKRTRK